MITKINKEYRMNKHILLGLLFMPCLSNAMETDKAECVEKQENDSKIEYRISSSDDYNQFKSEGYVRGGFNKQDPREYGWAVGGCYGAWHALGGSGIFEKLKAMHEAQEDIGRQE
jgi:hypothetical protein